MLRRKLHFVALLFLALASCGTPRAQTPAELLAEADRLALLFNWPKAAPLYAQAHAAFEKSGDAKNALAARFGYIRATAEAGFSPEVSEEVAKYLQDPIVQGDQRLLMRGLVAKAALDRDEYESAARGAWEQVLDLAKKLGDKRWEARAQAELSGVLYLDGDVKAAAGMVREALISQYLRADLAAAVNYTGMVGGGFVEAGQPETGLRYCNVALRLASVVKDIGFPYVAYQGKARALFALGRDAEADGVLREALEKAREEQNYVALTQLLVVAGIAVASDNPAKAIEHLKEAADLSEAKGLRHAFAWSTFELAKAYRQMGDLDDADSLASKAIEVMRHVEDRYHLPEHLALHADIHVRKGNFRVADELYSEATDVIDALLMNVTTRQLAGSLIATLSEAYLGHFRLATTQLSNPVMAYEIIEQARGRSLADALRGESETLSAGDDITVEAQKNINRIQLALLHEVNRDRRQSLLDDLFEEEQRLLPVRRSDAELNHATARPRPIPLKELQASLGRDEMLLEYVLDEPESFCLQITRTSIAVIKLPGDRKRIEHLVDEYRAAVESRRSEGRLARELFSIVLQPVLQESKGKLVIVPDGKLHLLPFDALRDPQGTYVLESKTVSYAPSATVLSLLRTYRASHQPTMDFLGVGDVLYPSTSIVAANTGGNRSSGPDLFDLDTVRIQNLPGTRQEVMSVAGAIAGPKQILLDRNATEAAFKALPLANFRVIHLAVHGVASTQFPNRAALIFGPGAGEDGLLQVREIQDLALSAELVTLSACETGYGKLLGQEGIASLERAFLQAGAKAVIASLWTVDDTYTVALMKRLYQHLIEGDDKGTALRQAKLDLLKQFGTQALPVYWAGFTLVGDASTPISQ